MVYKFNTEKPFSYLWCGKFQSPSPDWLHLTRRLIDFELIVVTKGTLYIASEDTEYTIKTGQYLLMAPTDYQHGYKKSDCSFYWLHFNYNNNQNNPEYLEDEDLRETYHKGYLIIPESGTLSSPDRIIVMMKQLQDSDKRYREANLNNYLNATILAELANQSSYYQKYGHSIKQKQLYNDICDYISLRVCENITLAELAEHFGYNKKYLTTFFRKQSGNTIKQFILQTKMDHAKAELSDTNHSIAQISYSIGYHDVHNFSNAFKKITGLAPSAYRDSYSKRNLSPI